MVNGTSSDSTRLLWLPDQAFPGHIRPQQDLEGDFKFSFSMTQVSSGAQPACIAPEASPHQRSPHHHSCYGFCRKSSASFAWDSPFLPVALLQVLFSAAQSQAPSALLAAPIREARTLTSSLRSCCTNQTSPGQRLQLSGAVES